MNVMKPVASTLTATVSVTDAWGRVRKASDVTIRFGDKVVANKKLGGEYTVEQAIREFKRSQKDWDIKDSTIIEQIKQLKLI